VNNLSQRRDDYDYIVSIISYLDFQFGIRFFISPRDFDLLLRWWEKRIPLEVIREALANVVERRKNKNRAITGFANFNYEVKKRFKSFLELTVGEGDRVEEPGVSQDPVQRFFENFPPQLEPLRPLIEKRSLQELDDALLELFANDDELAVKARIFLDSLAPPLRSPKIERKYRLNYLKGKFKIPDFEE
jgi:hypothetical protein